MMWPHNGDSFDWGVQTVLIRAPCYCYQLQMTVSICPIRLGEERDSSIDGANAHQE